MANGGGERRRHRERGEAAAKEACKTVHETPAQHAFCCFIAEREEYDFDRVERLDLRFYLSYFNSC